MRKKEESVKKEGDKEREKKDRYREQRNFKIKKEKNKNKKRKKERKMQIEPKFVSEAVSFIIHFLVCVQTFCI